MRGKSGLPRRVPVGAPGPIGLEHLGVHRRQGDLDADAVQPEDRVGSVHGLEGPQSPAFRYTWQTNSSCTTSTISRTPSTSIRSQRFSSRRRWLLSSDGDTTSNTTTGLPPHRTRTSGI